MTKPEKRTALLNWLKSATQNDIEVTGTTIGQLRQIGYGHRLASPKTAALIEFASAGAVLRKDLRADDWLIIWPELAA